MSTEWFYRIGEHEHGPVESKTLKMLADEGQISPNTLVRKATSKSWTAAQHVKQLFDAHNSTQPSIDAPSIIEQSSDSEHEKAIRVQPPPQVRAVNEPPPIIPTAELVTPESDAFTPQINIVPTPSLNVAAKDDSPSPNNATDDNTIKNNTIKRPLTLILTLAGLIILTIPTAWYLYSEPTTTDGNASTQVNSPPPPNANLSTAANSPPNHSLRINKVFSKQSQWIDPTNDQFQLTRDARLSLTHVWLDTQQTEQPILNIVIKIENHNKSIELSLQRQYANQNAANRTNELSPYIPLIRLTTGDGQALDSEAELVNRTIPMASEISETYQIALTVEQTAELDQLRVAVPKAWFNKSGYWGFQIPQVMITSTKPIQTPVQIASEPNSASGNLVGEEPDQDPSSNVGGENSEATKPPADGKGDLPPSPFGNSTTPAKPTNGDQPNTIQGLQSGIDLEKKHGPVPSGGELPQ